MTAPGGRHLRLHPRRPAAGDATDSSRDIVSTSNCNECHRQLGGIPGDNPESSGAGFHGGNRNETRYCVVCHTEQRKYGRKEATLDATDTTFVKPATRRLRNNTVHCTYVFNGRAIGNLPNHIHQIHMGELLASRRATNYAGAAVQRGHVPAGPAELHEVPRRLGHLHREDRAGRQLEERSQPASPAAAATTASTSRPARA